MPGMESGYDHRSPPTAQRLIAPVSIRWKTLSGYCAAPVDAIGQSPGVRCDNTSIESGEPPVSDDLAELRRMRPKLRRNYYAIGILLEGSVRVKA
jgi:hypothetical protein